jgi:hypothetical protein
MLKRLFIKLPLFILFFIGVATFIIPIGYWVITGKNYVGLMLYIEDL